MRPDLIQETKATSKEFGLVSGRFLSDIFSSLERHNIPATRMLGDLPIAVDENGCVTRPVEWADFAAFLKRLEHHLGGPSELETCGERIGELEPAKALRGLAAFSASPYSLYLAAIRWAVRRAIPGVEIHIEKVQPNQLEIRMGIRDGLRPCPQLFHLATGAARTLPRILGMRDAVVIADVREFEANYQIMVPPSRTILSRVTRVVRSLFSASSVLQFLEAQQLELQAKHASLKMTNASLAASERRYQAITDTAVDVLCEINARGRIEYVSASVEDLMGYSPEQVAGSHFSLWVPTADRERAKKRFDGFAVQTTKQAITREPLKLLAESGAEIEVELSLGSYRTPEGELRMVGIIRYQTDRRIPKQEKQSVPREHSDQNGTNALRSTIERLREFESENSIEKSLASLLAVLEASPFDHREGARDRTIAATARMTQIVENAMVRASGGPTNFRWVETKELVERVQFEFLANKTISEFELQIDVSSAPSVVWGEEALLSAGLGSLLDWAAERARAPHRICLCVEGSSDPTTGKPAVVFSVSTTIGTGSRRSENRPSVKADSDLALATAQDAATALGGVLMPPHETSQRTASRIHLAQPRFAAD